MICTSCNAEKSPELMTKDKSYPTGRRPICTSCKNTKDAVYRAKAKERSAMPVKPSNKPSKVAAKTYGLGGWTGPRKREEHEATGWLISKMGGVYVPESAYYRNDGLASIKSRGTLC